jgi:hypothetical protein
MVQVQRCVLIQLREAMKYVEPPVLITAPNFVNI